MMGGYVLKKKVWVSPDSTATHSAVGTDSDWFPAPRSLTFPLQRFLLGLRRAPQVLPGRSQEAPAALAARPSRSTSLHHERTPPPYTAPTLFCPSTVPRKMPTLSHPHGHKTPPLHPTNPVPLNSRLRTPPFVPPGHGIHRISHIRMFPLSVLQLLGSVGAYQVQIFCRRIHISGFFFS